MLRIVKSPFFALFVIGVAGLLIRLHYFPYNLPIILDGSIYFWYANDMSLLGSFPNGYNFPNNGWPSFLSLFFSLLRSENFLDFMYVQRLLTISISVLTVIPIYLLARRFVEKQYALIASGIFIFEPRIIINALLGITESSFILLSVLSLYFVLGNKIRYVYIGFGIAAIAALIRYEGLLLLAPLSVSYFCRFRPHKQFITKYFIALAICVLILIPMTYERIQTTGNDGLISHITAAAKAHPYIVEHTPQKSSSYYDEVILNAVLSLIRYIGWVQIPIFIFFVPLALVIFLKEKRDKIKDHRIITLLVFTAAMLLPAIYAYSRGIQETRYLYILFPVFCLMSAYAIRKMSNKFGRTRIFVMVLFASIIMISIGFIEIKGLDTKHQLEAFTIANKISKISQGINPYSEDEYIKANWISNQKFPTLRSLIIEEPKLIFYNDTTSYYDYIKQGKENGLTHIVTDGLFRGESDIDHVLNNVFTNEDNYPYLQKIYDSSEDGYSYHLKVFEIKYEKIESN